MSGGSWDYFYGRLEEVASRLQCERDPISMQLAGIISKEDGEQLDRDNEAINRCYILGYIPEAVTAKARKKLMAKCQKAVSKHAQVNGEYEPRPSNTSKLYP